MVVPVSLLDRQVGETDIEVTLNGTQIDPKLIGQRLWVQLFTLVQLHQHLSKAIDQRIVII